MRAALCAILASLALTACVRHDPYPSYAAVPSYGYYYDPSPGYYAPYRHYAPRQPGFSIVIGRGHHRHPHHHRGHYHRHRW